MPEGWGQNLGSGLKARGVGRKWMPATLSPRELKIWFLSSGAWRAYVCVRSFAISWIACPILNSPCCWILPGIPVNLTAVSKAWFANAPLSLGSYRQPWPTQGMAALCLPTSQQRYAGIQLEIEGHPNLSLSGCSAEKRSKIGTSWSCPSH